MKDKKTKIIDAFMQLACENPNLQEISVKLIAEKAGIGKGTVYEYFDSKDEIIKDAVELIIDKMFVHYLVDDYDNLNFEDALMKYIHNNYEAAKKVGEYSHYNSFTIRETFKYVNMKDFLHTKIMTLLLKSVTLFKTRVVDRGIEEGIVDPDIDDFTIRTLAKVLLRDITENVEFKMFTGDDLIEGMYKFSLKQLKK